MKKLFKNALALALALMMLNFGAALGKSLTADMLPAFDDVTTPATRGEVALYFAKFYTLISQ